VRNGLAFDWPRYSKGRYVGAQRKRSARPMVFGRGAMSCRGPIGRASGMAGG
jgi:hypothetical protein